MLKYELPSTIIHEGTALESTRFVIYPVLAIHKQGM
jgi:hypothetical protein